MYFRTNRDDGLLFYTGDQNDYLSLAIKDGGVSLSINLGNGRLDTGIRNRVIRFDDDVWHNVVITRVAQKHSMSRSQCHVTMTVDGTYTEKWTTSGTFSMLSSNKVFIGGSSQPYKLPGANSKANFVGCMKKVEMKADSLYLPLLKLAKQGNRLMSSSGFISYSCRPIEAIKPVAFTSDDSHVANYFMMQQGGVVSISKPSSYLVRNFL
jgi:leucine-rich repeat transmembrane neuronal protein 1/2